MRAIWLPNESKIATLGLLQVDFWTPNGSGGGHWDTKSARPKSWQTEKSISPVRLWLFGRVLGLQLNIIWYQNTKISILQPDFVETAILAYLTLFFTSFCLRGGTKIAPIGPILASRAEQSGGVATKAENCMRGGDRCKMRPRLGGAKRGG